MLTISCIKTPVIDVGDAKKRKKALRSLDHQCRAQQVHDAESLLNHNSACCAICYQSIRIPSVFLGLEQVLFVYGENQKKALTVGMEPVTSRSLGGHHIHYTTAT
ncbi:hypothetical protein DPMN_162632 [Dreissena polymorpha]|uniref:Uncharacterized protein n=1 Tax=Dreissena polymorpha TaxID=45954 RepID=A0A9D4IUL0_DREPO|nr:hypothetical protein DPMN_162632 [Dreissena polymorpha]